MHQQKSKPFPCEKRRSKSGQVVLHNSLVVNAKYEAIKSEHPSRNRSQHIGRKQSLLMFSRPKTALEAWLLLQYFGIEPPIDLFLVGRVTIGLERSDQGA